MPVSSLIIGVDLLPIRPIRGVTTIQADITTEQCKKQIKQELQTWDVDVVVHDGAPNVAGGGQWVKDAYIQNELVIHSLRLATTVLRQGGWFITKIFRSQDYNSLLWVLQQFFKKVEVTKPQASRNASAEIFCVCQGYLAPKKIDAKLLDPNEIFQSFEGDAKKKKVDVFSAESKKQKRNRAGYEDVNNMTQTTKLSVVDFIQNMDTTEAIQALGDATEFTFEPPRVEEANSVPGANGPQQQPMDPKRRAEYVALLDIISKHAATTPEVLELCKDTRVLGKGDFKALLKWRGKVQDYLKQLEDEAKKADGRWEAEEAARKQRELEKAMEAEMDRPTLSAEENFERELRELRIKKALDAKKEKKKKREMKAKQSKRTLVNAHNLKESAELIGNEGSGSASAANLTSTGGVGGEEGLFTLRSIKSKDALDYVAETEGKGKIKSTKTKDADNDEDMASDDDEDASEEDESESELYASILQEQNEAFEAATSKGGKNKNGPRNIYEDQEEALLAKIKARDARKAGSSLSTEAGVVSLGNVRGDDTDQSYYAKLEKDLDFMYESYKERRDIKSKNRNGGSELDMSGEAEGNELLKQARREEKSKLKSQAENRKRKRDAGDSDTDDDDDMDRFNSDDADDSEESDEDGAGEGEDEAAVAAASNGGAEDDSDDEEGDNPLIRKLRREEAPSNTQRMNRWFQRGLLAEAEVEGEERKEAPESNEEPAPRARKNQKASAQAASSRKPRSLVQIGVDDASSSEEDVPAGRSGRGASDIDDDDMSDAGEAGGDRSSAASFFSNGKLVKTKSGLKPNSVFGLDGLKRSTKDVQADVIDEEKKEEDRKKIKVKRGKDGKPLRAKSAAAPQYDEDGDLIDTLKVAEKQARASLKKTTKNYKAQDKALVDAEKEKSESFEIVPISAEDEAMEHLSSDDDAIAERLALGKHMLAKKSRNALINDSYNRYSLDRQELSQLPEWFVRDEAQHHTPILPVSKAEVDTYKEQLRAINARPIKKIAEAKVSNTEQTAMTHASCSVPRLVSVCSLVVILFFFLSLCCSCLSGS